MRVLTIATLLISAPSLLAEARLAAPNATAPTEAVNWTAGVNYTYDASGNVTVIGRDNFRYDETGRLVQAEVNGVTRVYTYDAFGNRTGCTHEPNTGSASDCQIGLSIDPESNRVQGVAYDRVGNVQSYYGHTYSYDALNMPVRDDRGPGGAREFVYTADDERIAIHTVGSNWDWSIRDVTGKVLREFTSDQLGVFTLARDYVYRDGMLLASVQPLNDTTVTHHYHLDHLGTPRRVTDQNNRIIGFHDYFAFGPEVSGGLTEPNPASLQYTGHERDKWGAEGLDTLDYMHARYYSPTLGRFLSLDRASADTNSPQTWNRYAYARNSPLRVFDPDGKWGRDIIVVPITIVMATRDKDLQHRAQRSLARAQNFFAQADIHFSVKRMQATLTYEQTFVMGPSRLDGTVNTPNGPQGIGDFVKNTQGLVVIVGDTGKFTTFSGETNGLGGPTLLGTGTEDSTVSDELAHALGNIPPFAEAISNLDSALGGMYHYFGNGIADLGTNVEEGRTAIGLGLSSAYENMLRAGAGKVICPHGKIPGTSGPCD